MKSRSKYASFLGRKHTEKTKRRMRRSARRRWRDPKWRRNLSRKLKGRVFTEEWKEKIRETKNSPEFKKRISEIIKQSYVEHPELRETRRRNFADWNQAHPEARQEQGRKRAEDIRSGKVQLSSICYKNGWFISKKNGKKLHYRSGLELDWYQRLEADPLVKRFYVEHVVIPYYWNGVRHYYVPDLFIRYQGGHKHLVEIKPEYQWSDSQNLAKWRAARSWCRKRNRIIFRVLGYNRAMEEVRGTTPQDCLNQLLGRKTAC